jgi:DNA-binding Lrp family transcriptional regulator
VFELKFLINLRNEEQNKMKNENIVTYLLINLDIEISSQEVAAELASIPEVVEAHVLYGTYDVLIRIETKNAKDIKDITLKSVRSLKHVLKTMTMISLETYDK